MARKTMATPARKGTHNGAQPRTKAGSASSPLVDALQQQTANSIILYLNYKHYHWQTYGPRFRDLHLMFDEFATAVFNSVDELAERIRILGANTVHAPSALEAAASISPAAASDSMQQMIAEARANESTVISEMRDAAALADDQHDPGTADLFTRVVQIHEKHEWFLRETLMGGDPL
ncbi:MAG TPA: DNA starvation/stationary phase protection protein [Candidatus Kapabacteria bacterium]|nr:DNA starvation/stationary phase protection protein [Candidatus Kapabacteria bacterium]